MQLFEIVTCIVDVFSRKKHKKEPQKAARGAVIISLSLVNRRSWRARDIGMVDTCCLWGGSNISKSACAGGREGKDRGLRGQ